MAQQDVTGSAQISPFQLAAQPALSLQLLWHRACPYWQPKSGSRSHPHLYPALDMESLSWFPCGNCEMCETFRLHLCGAVGYSRKGTGSSSGRVLPLCPALNRLPTEPLGSPPWQEGFCFTQQKFSTAVGVFYSQICQGQSLRMERQLINYNSAVFHFPSPRGKSCWAGDIQS